MSYQQTRTDFSDEQIKEIFSSIGFDLQTEEGRKKASEYLEETKEMIKSLSPENLSKISQYIEETKELER